MTANPLRPRGLFDRARSARPIRRCLTTESRSATSRTTSRARSALLVIAFAALAGAGHASISFAAAAQAGHANAVEKLVRAAIAGDQTRVEQIAAQLKSQPRPMRGNRRLARQQNEQGLAYWQRQRFSEAANLFRQAHRTDPGDAEIAENLGYALLKSGQVQQAEPAILSALALAPERASAWGSLGQIYAKQGKHREGVAAVLTAYRYAPDRKRAFDVYSRLAVADEDPKVRSVLAEVVSRLSQAERGMKSSARAVTTGGVTRSS